MFSCISWVSVVLSRGSECAVPKVSPMKKNTEDPLQFEPEVSSLGILCLTHYWTTNKPRGSIAV